MFCRQRGQRRHAAAAGQRAQQAAEAPLAGAAAAHCAQRLSARLATHLSDAPQILIGLQAAGRGSRTAEGQGRAPKARLDALLAGSHWRLGGGAPTSIAHAHRAQLPSRAVKGLPTTPPQLRSATSGVGSLTCLSTCGMSKYSQGWRNEQAVGARQKNCILTWRTKKRRFNINACSWRRSATS